MAISNRPMASQKQASTINLPATAMAWFKSVLAKLSNSSMWLLTCNNKIPPTTTNLAIAFPSSINALVPTMRFKPLKGLSLLNLGASMPKENTMPPDKTVDTMAMKYISNMMGRISKKASTKACAKYPGSKSALSVILRSNSNWDTNILLMPLNNHPPMRLKNPTAPKAMAAMGNS